MNTFILASASPRRTELLRQIGIQHIVIPSECPEHTEEFVPGKIVEDLSQQKAKDIFSTYQKIHSNEGFTVLGADTIVVCEDNILGKPKHQDDARQMLTRLQNNTHQVYTGVTLIQNHHGIIRTALFHECSKVSLYPMTTAEITAYIETGEPLDKAGSYGIQGCFARHIKGIEGDYNNIVGLPVGRLYQELKQLNQEDL